MYLVGVRASLTFRKGQKKEPVKDGLLFLSCCSFSVAGKDASTVAILMIVDELHGLFKTRHSDDAQYWTENFHLPRKQRRKSPCNVRRMSRMLLPSERSQLYCGVGQPLFFIKDLELSEQRIQEQDAISPNCTASASDREGMENFLESLAISG